jgi:hypothetical protein
MAVPTCPSCKSITFETSEFTPKPYKYKLLAVHCSVCGAIAAIIDYYNVNKQIDNLTETIESIQAKLNKP